MVPEHGTIDDFLSLGGKVLGDDALCLWKSIEGDLWEKMVFGLELHSPHEHEPPEVALDVVPAGHDLVVHEAHVDFLVDPVLPLVVADEHEGGVESPNEVADHEVQDVAACQDEVVVDCDEDDVDLSQTSSLRSFGIGWPPRGCRTST